MKLGMMHEKMAEMAMISRGPFVGNESLPDTKACIRSSLRKW